MKYFTEVWYLEKISAQSCWPAHRAPHGNFPLNIVPLGFRRYTVAIPLLFRWNVVRMSLECRWNVVNVLAPEAPNFTNAC